ncbi:partial Valine--tRNA ligase, partial [Geobacteraceae bacterium]
IRGIRNIRGEMDVAPSREIAVILNCGSEASLQLLKKNEVYIMSLARVADLAIGTGLERPVDAAISVAGDVEVAVPLRGLVDVEEEEKRLLKEIGKLDKDVEFLAKKLENPSFVERAPADVVAKEREKLAEFSQKKEVLLASLDKIRNLK